MGFFTKNNDPFGANSRTPPRSITQPTTEVPITVPLPPTPTPVPSLTEKIDMILSNQAVILQNQQLTVDVILGLGKDMRDTFAPEVFPNPEPTPEELRAAALELRKKKEEQSAVIPKKKGMPKGGWPKK